MAKIGIFYGSTGGNTAKVAKAIGDALGAKHEISVVNIADISDLSDLLEYKNLILGSSTWGQGGVQADWREPLAEMDEADFTGKTVALFGAGDGVKHKDAFADAIGILYDKVVERGATVVGAVSVEGYSFESSQSAREGKFVGLAIDETNEPNRTMRRVSDWVKTIEGAFSD